MLCCLSVSKGWKKTDNYISLGWVWSPVAVVSEAATLVVAVLETVVWPMGPIFSQDAEPESKGMKTKWSN